MDTQPMRGPTAPALADYESDVHEAIAAGKIVWEVMDASGDLKHTWDPASATDIENMRRMFEELTKERKYRAYHVTDDHEPGEPMERFRATAGRVIFRPQFVGG